MTDAIKESPGLHSLAATTPDDPLETLSNTPPLGGTPSPLALHNPRAQHHALLPHWGFDTMPCWLGSWQGCSRTCSRVP